MMTSDKGFAAIAAHRTLTLEPSTGALTAPKGRGWFRK
jgi:hypothetical protein